MRIYRLLLVLMCQCFLITPHLAAKINLPEFFTDHMVLQQNSNVPIWGWGRTNEELVISVSWDSVSVTTKVNNHAAWKATLNTPSAGGPFEIIIRQKNDSLLLKDIMIGEVWLASGQSNMDWTLLQSDSMKLEIAEANYSSIRLFQVVKRSARCSQVDLKGEWLECTPSSAMDFSAVSYYFAKKLHKELDIPIGVIQSSWGGTGAEVWLSPSIVLEDREFTEAAKLIPENPYGPTDAGSVYSAMIAPLIPFKIAGVIWYQGESNRYNSFIYERLFSTLINTWRDAWNYIFPFYYVQIAPYNYKEPREWLMIQEAQFKSMSLPKTGMVVISDIGDTHSMHPVNKEGVGIRLANWALAKTYNKEDIICSGPLYKHMKIEDNRIRIFFDYSRQGLVSGGGELTHFQIAGEDQVFIDAKAVIEGNTVIVYTPEIKKPIAVRFSWSNAAEPNLFNMDGLPASCFRTDTWEN